MTIYYTVDDDVRMENGITLDEFPCSIPSQDGHTSRLAPFERKSSSGWDVEFTSFDDLYPSRR